MFIQLATGPSILCAGNIAIFNCTIAVVNTNVIVDSLWRRNGAIITDTTPGYTLLHTGEPSQITGLMVDNTTLDDDGTVYTCTSEGAPNDFISTAILNVTGGIYLYVIYKCVWCTNNNNVSVFSPLKIS